VFLSGFFAGVGRLRAVDGDDQDHAERDGEGNQDRQARQLVSTESTDHPRLSQRRRIECRRYRQTADEEGWRVYFTDIREVAIYCPDCAGREFRGAPV